MINKFKSVGILVFLLVSIYSNAQKVIELPFIETNSHVQSLLIKSIELSKEYTVVNVRYVNALGAGWIRTYKPGNKRAYYIADKYGNRLAELINAKNIPYAPKKRKMRSYDEVVDFTLIFEPIEQDLKTIDIIEGNADEQGNFNFYGVYLDGKNATKKPKGKIVNGKKVLVGSGTGFLINTDGYVATNYHVIDDASEIELVFPIDGINVSYSAEILLTDKTNDLALLKIDDPSFRKLDYLPYEISVNYEVGEEVYTIGYPQPDIMGTEPKLTTGIINALSGIDNDNTHTQISVQIQPGNSGGPLFNSNGNVVGITTSTLNPLFMAKYKGNIPQNVNYAVKSEYLKVLSKTLKMDGKNIIKDMDLKDKNKTVKRFICLVKVFGE